MTDSNYHECCKCLCQNTKGKLRAPLPRKGSFVSHHRTKLAILYCKMRSRQSSNTSFYQKGVCSIFTVWSFSLRLCSDLLPGVSLRQARGIFMQEAGLLWIMPCSSHERDGGTYQRFNHTRDSDQTMGFERTSSASVSDRL